MKPWHILLMAIATAWPVRADTVLVQEDFDATAGKLVDGWNGWTGNSGVVISKTTIDRGKSATWNGNVQWPFACKAFSYKPRAGEQYEFVATLHVSNANGGYADVRLVTTNGTSGKHVAAQIDKGVLGFEQNGEYNEPNGEFIKNYIHLAQTAATMDVRMVVSDDGVQCYYRNHGAAQWQYAGKLEPRNPLAAYNNVMVCGRRVGGNIDSIRLAVKEAEGKK
jgi:hypothetical protein